MGGPKKVSKKQFWLIHGLALLSLFALWGYLETNTRYLILLSALSFYGALCVVFIALLRKKQAMAPLTITGRAQASDLVAENVNGGITLRRAEEKDALAILKLWKEMHAFHAARNSYYALSDNASAEFSQFLSSTIRTDNWLVIVAEAADGKLIGFSQA